MFKWIDKALLTEVAVRGGIALVIVFLTFVLAKLVKKVLARREQFASLDSIQYKFLSHLIRGLIYFFGFLMALHSIPHFRGMTTPVFAGTGIVAIIVGFASQQALSNVLGGIFLAIFKPFRIGDRLKVVDKNIYGVVEDITLRHTVVRTFEYKRIIVPNSVMGGEILENENIVDQRTLKFFDMGISYDSDIDKAIRIVKEEAQKHPEFLDNRSEEEIAAGIEPVIVRVYGFGDSSVNLRAYVWVKNPTAAFVLGCDLNKSVKERFDAEGIEIPFPYRTLVFKDPAS